MFVLFMVLVLCTSNCSALCDSGFVQVDNSCLIFTNESCSSLNLSLSVIDVDKGNRITSSLRSSNFNIQIDDKFFVNSLDTRPCYLYIYNHIVKYVLPYVSYKHCNLSYPYICEYFLHSPSTQTVFNTTSSVRQLISKSMKTNDKIIIINNYIMNNDSDTKIFSLSMYCSILLILNLFYFIIV